MADTPNINDVMNQIQSYIDNYDDFEQNGPKDSDQHQPTIGELDQFRKDWFYDDWQIRFRELNAFYPLGTKGVVAIPNTTFEEWLYWFQQWAIAFEQDYNKFKKLVFDTIKLIEKHLEAIDKTLEDHEKRIEKLEDEVAELQKEVAELQKEVAQIQQQIQDIYNQLQNINHKLEDLQNQINQNNQNTNDKLKQLEDEIEALKLDLKPSYMNINNDNEGAQNGWHTNDQAQPNQFHIEYRWANNNDHSQGLYMRFACNRVYNDNFNPSSDLNGHLLMSVDLTNFINETHAQLPHAPGSYGWIDAIGSYWNDQQRAGLQYQYQMNGNTMNIYISSLYGVASMMNPGRYETEGGSDEWYVSTN